MSSMFLLQVMVVSFGRLWDTEVILSLLDKAVNDGHWLVFNCCHLLERWDIKLVAQLNEVMSRFRGKESIKYLFDFVFL